MARPPPPRIDPRFLHDDTALGATIDALLQDDRRMRRHVEEILRRQAALQSLCDDDAWATYLDVEQSVNARYVRALTLVARWAWGQGREHELGKRGAS